MVAIYIFFITWELPTHMSKIKSIGSYPNALEWIEPNWSFIDHWSSTTQFCVVQEYCNKISAHVPDLLLLSHCFWLSLSSLKNNVTLLDGWRRQAGGGGGRAADGEQGEITAGQELIYIGEHRRAVRGARNLHPHGLARQEPHLLDRMSYIMSYVIIIMTRL